MIDSGIFPQTKVEREARGRGCGLTAIDGIAFPNLLPIERTENVRWCKCQR